MTQRYADSSSSQQSSGNNSDNVELRLDTYTTLGAEFTGAYLTDTQFGQSLGVTLGNVTIQDGALYAYPEKGYYKLFSWSSVAGLDPEEKIERGQEPHADDAPEVETKTYASNENTYELVAARVPEITDEDGAVLVEPSSKVREIDMTGSPPEFTEWEDMGGEPIEFSDTIIWYSGSEDYGPSAASKQMLKLVTKYGSDAEKDEDDIYNWLPEAGVGNVLRDDLEGRQMEFYTITRQSDNGYTYNVPVIRDATTGQEVRPNNVAGDDSDELAEARQSDSSGRAYPEPIADFIQSGNRLGMTTDRAQKLLNELMSDETNPLTESMVEDNGGEDQIITEATG